MTPAESVLGCILRDPALFWRVAAICTEADFPASQQRLFAYLRSEISAGKSPDAVTAMSDGFDEAIDLASGAYSSANLDAYARIVAEDGERRRVRDAGKRITCADTYADAQQILAQVRPSQTLRIKTATDGLREFVDALQQRFNSTGLVTGCPTGLESLDAITSGWQPGDLVGIAGATSSGKTAFAVQAALAAGRCYYGSLEMTAAQLLERAVCNVGRIPAKWLKFPADAPDETMTRVHSASVLIHKSGLLVDDQPGLSFDQIASRIRQAHMESPLSLAVVDHMNLIRRPRKNDNAELGEIAIGLKNLAKDLGIPVMALVQLNRASGQGRPELAHLRNSGEIEEALDTCVMVHRDEYHNQVGPLRGYAEFIVRKQRQGERNVTAWAESNLGCMRFDSCDPPSMPVEAKPVGFRRFGGAGNG